MIFEQLHVKYNLSRAIRMRAGEMRNGRPKAALFILLLALFVFTGPGSSANYTGSSSTNTTTTITSTTIANTYTTVLRNLTIGYLTAAKGNLENRQGLAISGALTLALKEVSADHQPALRYAHARV